MYYKIINKKKKIATILADLIGYALFTPVKYLQRKSPQRLEIKNILIIRTAYIGDVVMALPILKPLKQLYPDAEITFLTSSGAQQLFLNNPYVDSVIPYDAFWFYPKGIKRAIVDYWKFLRLLRSKSYDLVIEARGDIRDIMFIAYPSKTRDRVSFGFGGGSFLLTHIVPYTGVKHKLGYHLDIARYLGCTIEDIEWGVYLTVEEKKRIRDILEGHGIRRPFIAVHPGARGVLRRWMTERYAQLYDRVAYEYGLQIVIVSSTGEEELIDHIMKYMHHKPCNLTGKISLRELAGVLSESMLFICNNSGPLHLAASMKTPTVVIHGPSKTYWDAPYGNIHQIVEKEFPCREKCNENSCHNERYHACMKDITVEDAFEAVKAAFEEVMESKPYLHKPFNERKANQAGN